MDLRGARVLVTGGSSGIGLAAVRQLAARGCALTLIGSDPDRVCRAASAPPELLPRRAAHRVDRPPARGLVCDFADPAAVATLAGSLSEQPAFDLVVHGAGIGLRAPAIETTGEDLARLFAVNVHAAATLTAALLPSMIVRGRGRLAFVGSIAGAVGAAGEAAYAASKAALAAYATSLRVELAGTGVGVTVQLPGAVDTAFFDRRGIPYHRSRPRLTQPQRVAAALLRGVERERDMVVVPAWLRVPIALHGAAPQWFGTMAARWGR